jgi:hypothetical protein
MNTLQDSDLQGMRKTARKIGRRIYLSAALLEAYAVLLVLFVGFSGVWQEDQTRYRHHNILQAIDRLLADSDFVSGSLAFLMGWATFILVTWLLGSSAGGAIGWRRKGFGWVGPLTMLLPSLLGTLAGTIGWGMLNEREWAFMMDWPLEYFLAPVGGITLLVWVPSIVVGLIAGLLVRQVADEQRERLAWGPKPSAPVAQPDDLDPQVPETPSASKKWGALIFGIGTGFLLVSYLVILATIWLDRGPHASLTGFATGLLVLIPVSVLVGRWLAVRVRQHDRPSIWLGAGLMFLPALVGGVVASLGRLRDLVLMASISTDAVMANAVLPICTTTMMYFVPAATIGAFAALILRYIGRGAALMDQ